MTEVLPERYEVTRRGTPDPEGAAYYVLDHAHDYQARIALRMLVRNYRQSGQHTQADELELALERSEATFAEMIARRNDAIVAARKGKKSSSRSAKKDFTPS